MEETDLLHSERGPVDWEGCGVPQNGRNRPPTVETGVLMIERGVAYRKMGLHGIWFISTVDLLQPPRATVHPALHRLLFNQPSTGSSCSSSSPPAIVQPPLDGHPSTVYCSSSPPHHGVLFIQRQRHRSLFIHPPPAMLTVHPIDRLQLAAVAKESLDRVQLAVIDRSLGFSNA